MSNEALRIKSDELSLYETILQKMPSHRFDPQFISQWITALKEGVEDASIALLLVVCPNIQTLIYPDPHRPSFFARFLIPIIEDSRNDGGGPTEVYLSKLRNVKHFAYKSTSGFGPQETRSWLLWMSKIRTYEGYHLDIGNNCCEAIDQITRNSRRSCLIESLGLSYSSFSPSAFCLMANACRGLRKVQYTHNTSALGKPEQVTPRDIITALLPHAASLEWLHITYSYGGKEWYGYASSPEP
jgi:hypothetical protein